MALKDSGGTGVNILRDSIEGGQTGSKVIGTGAAVQLTGPLAELESGVLFRCPSTNAGNVYLGFKADLTPGTVDATDGIIIEAGGDLPVPARLLSNLWTTADAASQKLFWMAQ